jgi:iron complex outermembrane receptor protein
MSWEEMNMNTLRVRALQCVSATALVMGVLSAQPVLAQTASTQTAPDDGAAQVDEVVVTGIRGALRSALSTKRNANVMVDAINAEDIADFPDANLAESLQRLPGVSIDRDNGEGRTITVRGLGSDFTRVRLNGVEALSTAGASIAGDSPNRSRGFDFNTFASELFNSLKVQKTASAETEEGSLGATVDLQTGRPFDYRGARYALSVQDAYYENGETNNPRVAALVSDRWRFNHIGEFGLLGSIAYNKRDQTIDSYQRQAGQSDYTYRGATFAGTPNIAAGTSILTRQGFAAPTGTSVQQRGHSRRQHHQHLLLRRPARFESGGLQPDQQPDRFDAAQQQRHRHGRWHDGGSGLAGPHPGPADAEPAGPEPGTRRDDLFGALQWRPTDRTTVSFDGVYSQLDQVSTNYQIVPVGLNRNNTQGTANQATYQLANANPRAPRPSAARCTPAATHAPRPISSPAVDCGQQMYGTTPVALVGRLGFQLQPQQPRPVRLLQQPDLARLRGHDPTAGDAQRPDRPSQSSA